MIPVIVPTYAAVLVLIYVFLSVRVIQMRTSAKISLGIGNNPLMEQRVRAHGNFAEYVPFAVLLLVCMEMQRHSIYLIHVLCVVLILARLCHAIGLSLQPENLALRVVGVVGTVVVLVVAALALLGQGLRAAFI